jgi:hypothetical protein
VTASASCGRDNDPRAQFCIDCVTPMGTSHASRSLVGSTLLRIEIPA